MQEDECGSTFYMRRNYQEYCWDYQWEIDRKRNSYEKFFAQSKEKDRRSEEYSEAEHKSNDNSDEEEEEKEGK